MSTKVNHVWAITKGALIAGFAVGIQNVQLAIANHTLSVPAQYQAILAGALGLAGIVEEYLRSPIAVPPAPPVTPLPPVPPAAPPLAAPPTT